MTRISVIIVSYNAPLFLKGCIESVYAALSNISGEVIVIDNASVEANVKDLKAAFPELQIVRNTENMGFSKAVNQGAKITKGEFILVLNPDSILPEDILRRVTDFIESKENIGAAGCRFIDGAGAFLPECKRNLPDIKSALFKIFGKNRGYYAVQIEEESVEEVEVLTGAFMCMRSDLFKKLGGFDEDFFMFGEDIDLSYRILELGYKNYYLGDITMIHFKGESSVKDAKYLKHFYGALGIYYKKHVNPNRISDFLLQLLIKSMILIRGFSSVNESHEVKQAEELVYLGNRDEVYEKLSEMFPASISRKTPSLKLSNKTDEAIYYDSLSLGYSKIIAHFDQSHESIVKRIISRDGKFYFGSDSPTRRGEADCL